MDTSALSTLVPAGGLGAMLLVLAGYLLKQIPADRADFRQDLATARADFQKDLAAERQRTTDAEARTAAAIERAELAQLQVDEERQKRRDAEAAAAEARAAALLYRPPRYPPADDPEDPS